MSDITRVRFTGDVTLGNLITAFAMLVPLLVWGIRLESRVDFESVLRTRLERAVADQVIDTKARDARMEELLRRITEDVTAMRIRMGVMRDTEQPPNMRKMPQ